MNPKILLLIALSFAGAFLSSCVNLKPVASITQSYALGPVESQSTRQNTARSESIFIRRPHVPTYIDSRRLVYRAVNGEVKEVPGARWAEPIVEGIARASSLFLNEATGHDTVEGYYPWPNADKDASQLSIEFMRFSATEAGEVQVVARWTLERASGETKSKLFSSKELEWKAAEPESLIAAYNTALKDLVEEVVDSLN